MRKGQEQFRQKTISEHKEALGALFCRVCPVDSAGATENGSPIPLDAHHKTPYSEGGHNTEGLLICQDAHQNQIHTMPLVQDIIYVLHYIF